MRRLAGVALWRRADLSGLPGARPQRDDAGRRPSAALTAGLDDRHAILLTDLNWQVQNGLTYFGKEVRPSLAYARMPDVLLYAPALVADNLAIGREVR